MIVKDFNNNQKIFTITLFLISSLMISLSIMLVTPKTAYADGPNSYWKLDESSGASYIDVYNNQNGQCGSSCPTAVSGKIDGGQEFSGSQAIDVPANAGFNWGTNDSFSVEFWVKGQSGQTCSSADQVIVGRKDGAGSLNWSLGCANSTGYAFFNLTDTSGASTNLQSTKSITDGVWHHIVGIRDAGSSINRLYVDSTEVASTTTTLADFTAASPPLNIGYLDSGSYFEGAIDEVAVYSQALTQAEVLNHYYIPHSYNNVCSAPVRIMPLGDSITMGSDYREGVHDYAGYRQPLYLSLREQGFYVDFVGGLKDGSSYFPRFDVNHEGHGRATVADTRNYVYSYLQNNPADVILLHISSSNWNSNATVSADDIVEILDRIDDFERDYNTDITVILAQIINLQNETPNITQFNEDVKAMALARAAAGDRIRVVNMESEPGVIYAAYPDGDFSDGVHLTTPGYAKMAPIWFNSLKDFLVECPSPPFITSVPSSEGFADAPYTYDVASLGDPSPTYTLAITSPSGMSIDEDSGIVEWTPDAAGSYSVTVSAHNSEGSDSQTFSVAVTEPSSPVITSTPILTGFTSQLYSYDIEATGSPTPTYALSVFPDGMEIDQTSGLISWTPSDPGDYAVSATASNSVGTVTQTFSISVSVDGTPT
ncbi:MAG TPA: putative Ig domain-containing protein, partial [Anaerolineae bacterium]|nr:putative Ig domain-containing protein [Anaerolineae bacterium]